MRIIGPMYNGCFLAMRTALELQPAEMLRRPGRAGPETVRDLDPGDLRNPGGSVAVYGNEIDDLVVKGEFQGRGLGMGLLQWALALLESEGRGPAGSSTWQTGTAGPWECARKTGIFAS